MDDKDHVIECYERHNQEVIPSTTYDFYVKEACAPGDTSMTMYHVFTTDSCAAITLGNPQFNVDSVNATAAALTFNWNSTNTTGFNISFGDGNSATGTGGTVSHSYTANGTYSVTLTVYSDCDTASKTFNVQVGTIGIEDNAGITALMIYPNPTQGLVTCLPFVACPILLILFVLLGHLNQKQHFS